MHYAAVPDYIKTNFLLEKDSLNLQKANKAYLTNSLLNILNKKDIITCDDDSPCQCPHMQSDAIIIDLMALLRKLMSVELIIDQCYHIWIPL